MSPDSLSALNHLPASAAVEQFCKCCGATWWCDQMVASRPLGTIEQIHNVADEHFDRMTKQSWLEAFGDHPKIGDLNSLRMKFAGNSNWSAGEQAGLAGTDEVTLRALADGNAAYEQQFGYIFIVCATGRSATEMLAMLRERLENSPDKEFGIAAEQQRMITHLRMDKLEVKPV